MTDKEKLTLLRAMVGEQDEDAILSAYLKIAGEKIVVRAYPYGHTIEDDDTGEEMRDDSVPEQYSVLQCEIAAYLLNKRGAEGQVSHSENGISRTYGSDDVPTHLISQIVPYVGVL